MISSLSRLLSAFVLLSVISACDSNGSNSSQSQTDVYLQPPSILTESRAVSVNALLVDVVLGYSIDGVDYVVPETAAATGVEGNRTWFVSFDLPARVDVVLTMTWYENNTQRLDLIRLTREIAAPDVGNGSLSFAFDTNAEYSGDLTAPDYAGFDFDQDAQTNLEELLADSNPFAVDEPTEDPEAILAEVTQSLSLSAPVTENVIGNVSFTNTGGAPLDFSLTSNDEWLSVSQSGGVVQPNSTINLVVDASCPNVLDEFSLSGVLNLTSNGGNATIPVSLNCVGSGGPVLSDVTAAITRTIQVSQSSDAVLGFTNSGFGEDLQYTVASNQDWISITQSTGSLSRGQGAQIDVLLNCGASDELRQGEISITTNGGNATIPVSLECTAAPTPVLSVSSNSLILSSDSESTVDGAVTIVNSGTADLAFTATTDSTWLTLLTTSGTLSPSNNSAITASASCDSVIGDRTGLINLQSNGGNTSVTVTLTCLGARLGSVTPTNLELSAEVDQSDQSAVVLTNTGNTPLDVSIDSDAAWLCVDGNGLCSPTGQTFGVQIAAGDFYSVPVTAVCSSVAETRNGNLLVSSNGGSATVPVVLACSALPVPQLSVQTANVALSAGVDEIATANFDFSNIGSAPLNFTIETEGSWLQVPTPGGGIGPGDSASLAMRGICQSTVQSFSGSISILSDGGDATIPVTLDCRGAILRVEAPASYSFSAELGQTDQSFMALHNDGNDTLEFTVTSDSDWLCPDDPGSASCNSNPSTFSEQVEPGEFYSLAIAAECGDEAEEFAGSLAITGNAGTVILPATLECLNFPLSVTSVTFADSFTINSSNSDDYFEIDFGRPTSVEVTGTGFTLDVALAIAGGSCEVNSVEDTAISALCDVVDTDSIDDFTLLSVFDSDGQAVSITPLNGYVSPYSDYNRIDTVEPTDFQEEVFTEISIEGIFNNYVVVSLSDGDVESACEIVAETVLLVVANCFAPSTSYDQLRVQGTDGELVLGSPVALNVSENTNGADPVTIVSVTEEEGQYTVFWDDVASADYYELYQYDEDTGESELIGGQVPSGEEQASGPLAPLYLGALDTTLIIRSCNSYNCADSVGVNFLQNAHTVEVLSGGGVPINFVFANAAETSITGAGETLLDEHLAITIWNDGSRVSLGDPDTVVADPSPDGVVRIVPAGEGYYHPTATMYDRFGWSFDISETGEFLVVGAPFESSSSAGVQSKIADNDDLLESGAAYVYRKTDDGWVFDAQLKSQNPSTSAFFGYRVSVSGDGSTIAVGEVFETYTSEGDPPGVSIYRRDNSGWYFVERVEPLYYDGYDYFGISVQLSGDGSRLLVGASGESSSTQMVNGDQSKEDATNSGAAYVFHDSEEGWVQEAYLKSTNSEAGDGFGYSSAINAAGDVIAVGARFESSASVGIGGDQSDNSAEYSGAVYLFELVDGNWLQSHYIKASNTEAGDLFGDVSLDASGGILAVGASGEDSSAIGIGGDELDNAAPGSGAVYVFTKRSGSWQQTGYVKPSEIDLLDEEGFENPVLSSDGFRLGVGGFDRGHLY